MSNEIRILFPEQIYPEKISGGYLRTINLATLASEQFKTLLFGMAEGEFYEGKKSGVNLIQETKYKNFCAKLKHFTNGLLSNNYSLMNSKIAFKDFNPKESILQIENPLVYNMLKKRKIEN
ncbi:MAG: hypothetical protein K8E24_014820 [Methanobacterium paludis]|nr:hypothetical protein [Methanobacterium paludis]